MTISERVKVIEDAMLIQIEPSMTGAGKEHKTNMEIIVRNCFRAGVVACAEQLLYAGMADYDADELSQIKPTV